jgi:hypothetical protein
MSYSLRLHKLRGIFWLAEEILASQEGLCSRTVSQMFIISAHIAVTE